MKMSAEYKTGLAVGIAVALVLSVVVWNMSRKLNGGSKKPDYDERQKLERGIAYRNGYFTLMAYVALYALANLFENVPFDPSLGLMCGIMLSIMVFVVTAIRHDAYVSLNQNPRSWLICGTLIAGANLLSGIVGVMNGRLSSGLLSLMIAVMWIVIILVFVLHRRKAEAQEQEDEI
jgi:magnesium-transporting ATPase (P-type)